MLRFVTLVVVVSVGLFCVGSSVAADESPKSLRLRVESLGLEDYRGHTWHMDDFADSQYLVVAFLGVECPLAKQYAAKLEAALADLSEQGVSVVGVMSNRQDSLAEIGAFARRQSISFPLLKDAGNQLADRLGAERTPEVFLLDRERMVRYRGRIDDQFGIGVQRPKATRDDLMAAIADLQAGRPVEVPQTPAVGCIIGRARDRVVDGSVTYANQISRLLQQHCVACHRPEDIGPMSLSDYDEVAGWADMIAEVVNEKRMPPWHASPEVGEFSNDRSLTDAEIELVNRWVKEGAPLGDQADLPPPQQFVEGWQVDREPDLVVPINAEPYAVPATGEVKYQYFSADPQLTEDKWLEAAELRPGNHAVVHHILAFAVPPGAGGDLEGERGYLVGYSPGARQRFAPPGMATKLPAGSRLIFQVHYTPIGSPQTDTSALGLWFADPEKVTHEIVTTSALQPRLRIPPGESNWRTDATTPEELPNSLLLGFSPHMHMRGKSFRYELIEPDGQKVPLLDVPQYDFNWQTTYWLAEPRPIAAGSRMYCEAAFDNSKGNLSNPNPDVEVRWGDQTWDEMMIGYFHVAIPRDSGVKISQAQRGELFRQVLGDATRERLLKRFDTDQDQRLSRKEVPRRWWARFDQLDADADGLVTGAELQELAARQ
jgi:peroxiredoxin